jgi:hypothetical protein
MKKQKKVARKGRFQMMIYFVHVWHIEDGEQMKKISQNSFFPFALSAPISTLEEKTKAPSRNQ